MPVSTAVRVRKRRAAEIVANHDRQARTAMRQKIGGVIGRLEDVARVEVERRLAVFLGIAK
jgi:hypothetical protein